MTIQRHTTWALGVWLIAAQTASLAEDSRTAHAGRVTESTTIKPLEVDGRESAGDSAAGGGKALASDSWTNNYQAGLKALEHRVYDNAWRRFSRAESESARGGFDNARLVQARLGLARVALAQYDVGRAQKLFTQAVQPARRYFGAASSQYVQALAGLAAVNSLNGDLAKADRLAMQALEICRTTAATDPVETARILELAARLKFALGWSDEAEPLLKEAVSILEKNPGPQNLDLADALTDLGNLHLAQARDSQGQQLLERALTLKESAARYDQPSSLRGTVVFLWHPGAPGVKEIPDDKYPFRVLDLEKIRVATTLVTVGRSSGGRFHAALISITNNDSRRVEMGIGGVELKCVKPVFRNIPELHPDNVDRIYWERAVWDLTWKRPVLANTQRTRSSIGFLRGSPPDIADDYGGNVFGTFGRWAAGPRSIPDIVARERMHARGESILQPGVALATSIGALKLNPVTLGPHESRTGIVFFENQPFEEAMVRVTVGNSIFEFPFTRVEPW